MNAVAQVPGAIVEAPSSERWHRVGLAIASILCMITVAVVGAYGYSYYLLSPEERPFSPLHPILRPSGVVGINLGIAGVAMFFIIFLYPLRKRISWLARRGNSQHWLDYHIVLGLTAPVLIAYHASFKIHGIAGMAFWLMLAVAISGIIGRYLYAQVPRSLTAAELSLRELDGEEDAFSGLLAQQRVLSAEQLQRVLRMPSLEEVNRMSAWRAIGLMMLLDLARPFRVAGLRGGALHGARKFFCLGGLLKTHNVELEQVIGAARRKASLHKRVVFLERTRQALHLWHVIHRPFSYSFLVLALLHIGVVIGLGFV